jgi:signal transduction histidine kinase/ActR/RegA family two-component response regulator
MATGATPRGEPSPLSDADTGTLEQLVDKLREANQNLILATLEAQVLKEHAEGARQRQQEYLSMLAHELRNPLGAIKTAATLLERQPEVSPQAHRLQQIIVRQADHMAGLLNDLLDAALVNSHKIELETQSVPLAGVLERAIETVQPRLDEQNQRLSIDMPAATITIPGDAIRLVQIFSNLLVNASKFTPAGGNIGLRAVLDVPYVAVSVIDDGAGMAQDVLPHIFELFTQGPRTLARSEGGLGIGLNIVRNLVDMHGGTVRADSPGLGKGSVFTIRLPCTVGAAAASSANQTHKQRKPLRILLLEDNPDACAALQALFEADGHAVTAGTNGIAGLEWARKEQYDLLVCDVGLPGMDGIMLMEEIRAMLPARIGISIAISGYGDAGTRLRALAAGFDGYLVKPVEMPALLLLFDTLAASAGWSGA